MNVSTRDNSAELQVYLESLHDAAEVSIDMTKPFKLYLRSTELVYKQVEEPEGVCLAMLTLRQACIYCNESDYEKAYVLHMKFSK
jgi:uncharacterized UPF0160 family protein